MASSDAEIKDGFNIPIWMKTKPTKDFEPFAASPPGPDDPFFIKYPNNKVLFGTNVERDVSKVLKDSPAVAVKDRDWSKHTKSCQDVLHGIAPINTAANPISPKVVGTEDEFKGEGAACGTSVLKVANQMISSTRTPRGFTVAAPEQDASPPGASYNLAARRGSRSLPVTPVHSPPGSPNSRRRKPANRYFTSPFEPAEDAGGRSWLAMALLGFKKDLATSSSALAEDMLEARLHGSLAESVESLGPAPRARSSGPPAPPAPPAPAAARPAPLRPAPSELREMNFWSPTSM